MQECTRLLSCVMEAKTTLERVYRRWVTAVNCFCIPSRVMCWSSVIYYFSYMLVFVHFSYMLVLVHFGHSVFFFMYRLSTMSTQSSALLWSARFVVFFSHRLLLGWVIFLHCLQFVMLVIISCRIHLNRLLSTTTWFNSLMELLMSGVGANKR